MNDIVKQLGIEWYKQHADHVKRLLRVSDTAYVPCSEDMYHPELWKPASWKWFLETHLDVYNDSTIQHLDVGDRVIWEGYEAVVDAIDKTSSKPGACIYYWIKPVRTFDKVMYILGLWGPGHAVSVGDELKRIWTN